MNCDICNNVLYGKYVSVNGIRMHPACFNCSKCGFAIDSNYNFQNGKYYHEWCYNQEYGIKCCLCKNIIIGEYIIDFCDNRAHLTHNGINTICCKSCGIFCFENVLCLCNTCEGKIIHNKTQIDYSFNKILNSLSNLGLDISKHNIMIIIKPKEQINSNGINQLGYAQTTIYFFGKQRKFEHRISIVNNLPDLEFEGVLAHEMLHTWLTENEIKLPDYQTEGFCNLGSFYLYGADNSKHGKYLINNLFADTSYIYGDGFRFMNKILETHNWTGLIKMLFETKRGHELTTLINRNNNFSDEIEKILKLNKNSMVKKKPQININDIFNDF